MFVFLLGWNILCAVNEDSKWRNGEKMKKKKQERYWQCTALKMWKVEIEQTNKKECFEKNAETHIYLRTEKIKN